MRKFLILTAVVIIISITGWINSNATVSDVDWVQLTSNAAWVPRYGNAAGFISTGIYMAGSWISNVGGHDVWSTLNGIDWDMRTLNAAFVTSFNGNTRLGTEEIVGFNGLLYLTGGNTDYSYSSSNEVWESLDGADWTVMTLNAEFTPRSGGHGFLSFQNRLWVIGGTGPHGLLNDVWSSSDGITWYESVANAPWSTREAFGCVVFNGAMWVIGGSANTGDPNVTNGMATDAWYSTDGTNWTMATADTGFIPRGFFRAFTYNNRMFIVGGYDGLGVGLPDTWSTGDGVTWVQSAGTNIPTRYSYALAQPSDSIVVLMGGYDGSVGTYTNDVWALGINVTVVPTVPPGSSPTATPTLTNLPSRTFTETSTNTATPTPTPYDTPIDTLSPTITPTLTLTATNTPYNTFTDTWTVSPTGTNTPTITVTSTNITVIGTRTSTPTSTVTSTATVIPTITINPTPQIWYISTEKNGYEDKKVSVNIGFTKYPDLGSVTDYILRVDDGTLTRTTYYYLTNADNLDRDSDNRFLYTLEGLLFNDEYTLGLQVQNIVSVNPPLIAATIVVPTVVP